MNKRNILLTGSSGNLGRYLFDYLAINHAIIGIDKNPSDEQLFLGNTIKIDLTDFNDGIYFISLIGKNKSEVIKIMKINRKYFSGHILLVSIFFIHKMKLLEKKLIVIF